MISIEINPEAEHSFEIIFKFLIEIWNFEVATEFANLSDEAIKVISKNPHIGKPFLKNIRILVLHKNASVYYEYFENSEKIQILLYTDNRQNPESYLRFL